MVAVSLSQIVSAIVSLDAVYVLTGAVLMIFAAMTWRDRSNPHRITSACFWFLLGVIFAGGSFMPTWITGLLVLLMVALDGAGRVTRGKAEETPKEEQSRRADWLKNKIFLPVLSIPVVVLLFALICRIDAVSKFLGMDATRGAIVGLGFGGVAAMGIALMITRGSARQMMHEGRRINDAMGTVSILPQLLASLGVIFTAAKIGDLIARGIQSVVPEGYLFPLVLANCLGMALFTVVMGNSFAAFPVIATGVLSPLIIQPYGVDPAMVGIITLTAGSSGTLMTPMAANFNIVPTALLNMKDQYGVIKFQLPYALSIWTLHVVLMWAMIKLF
jgi:uncharacterized membrane protein